MPTESIHEEHEDIAPPGTRERGRPFRSRLWAALYGFLVSQFTTGYVLIAGRDRLHGLRSTPVTSRPSRHFALHLIGIPLNSVAFCG